MTIQSPRFGQTYFVSALNRPSSHTGGGSSGIHNYHLQEADGAKQLQVLFSNHNIPVEAISDSTQADYNGWLVFTGPEMSRYDQGMQALAQKRDSQPKGILRSWDYSAGKSALLSELLKNVITVFTHSDNTFSVKQEAGRDYTQIHKVLA